MTLNSRIFLFIGALLLAIPWSIAATAAEKVRRNVEVEWESVDGASVYEVQVIRKDSSNKKPQRFRVKVPSWSATIAPGAYIMQIRSFDDRDAPGDWSPPSDLLVKLPSVVIEFPTAGERLKASEDKEQNIKFKWNDVPDASKYRISVHSITSAWKEEKQVETNSAEIKVPVGEDFAWNVYAVNAKGEIGDLNLTDTAFAIQGPALKKPEIQKPISKYVSEVKWDAPPFSNRFSYELLFKNPKTKKWERLEAKKDHADNRLKLDISRPSGKYRLRVAAHGERRDDSRVSQLDFETRGGFRDPAALEAATMRDSITKPTDYYMIASYLLTQIQYQGISRDENTGSNFAAVGGTGRVGMGYQDPESNWGGFGIIDMSGFAIAGKNFTFASLEAHATRKLEFGQNGLLQVAAGVFSKELPIVLGSSTLGFRGVGKVRNIGPHAGFVYWFPLSQRLGLQTNARAYYTLMGNSTTGPKTTSSISYQYGLLGTYRLSSNMMGYAGYAYRKDEARYGTNAGQPESFAQPGQINAISIQGHYLNILLELSF